MLTLQATHTPAPVLPPANDGNFAKPRSARFIRVRYKLRNGAEQSLVVMHESTSGAIVRVIDLFGEQLRTCSARAL